MSRVRAFLWILLAGVGLVSGDYYSAISEVERLLDVEAFLVERLEDYLEKAQQQQENIERFLQHVEQLHSRHGDIEAFFGNPINAFTTIRRLVHDWKHNVFEQVFDTSNLENYKTSVSAGLKKAEIQEPTKEDLLGATRGLWRLQEMYKLPTKQLAKGILAPEEQRQMNLSLSASDCYEIGRHLCQMKEYSYGSEWLLEARTRLPRDPSGYVLPKITKVQILEQLSPAFSQLGNKKLAHKLNNEILDAEPGHEEAVKNKIVYEAVLARERSISSSPRMKVDPPQEPAPEPELKESQELYQRVCRGELRQSPKEQRYLRCWLSHQDEPYQRLSPFKVEQLSGDPYVAYFHDVLSDKESELIIEHGKGQVTRSEIGQTGNSTVSEIRTSQNTWLWYENNPWLADIKQRLEDITGLSTDTAEPLQLVNYGIGGQYEPHFDFMDDAEKNFGWKGNRLLTALFYLNDVPLGGATAFPFLHLAVPPVKGSLLVWYNLHRSLHKDFRTKHAGCPVLKGSKWMSISFLPVCNEWFHEAAQEFRRPCALTSDAEKFLELENK
ncbi:prolyl 4-hydroxylase subunit alpha-1 isoform X1 [Drosophila miranda]|uniref:prolyl 4-hydroxylase subunit alpha-1 isoform X1 n=1 Tax=Drosophila miranda TaxID=7229 RepID=UPI00143F2822|nr:prolyl 4-hydroxylase subunit alpha-1 isoform X1 [Drosophila miranda]